MTREARTLKDAIYKMIHQHPSKSLEAIAEEIGMAPSYLNRAALPDPDIDDRETSGVRFPLKKLIPLTRATDDFSALDYIEQALGRAAFAMPVPGASLRCLHSHLVRSVSEFGDLLTKFEEIICDERITGDEAGDFEREAYEAIREIVAFVEAVKQARACR